jgi:hypothetical protein
MKIFLSYASEDRAVAEEVYLALTAADHEVFFDRSELEAGADFHARIAQAIRAADLAVFLISSGSISPGSYSLTELRFMREKWPHPKDRLVSVRLEGTPFDSIPPYLKSVTVLDPEGDIAAEVLSAVDRLRRGKTALHRWLSRQPKVRIVFAVVAAALLLLPAAMFGILRSSSPPTAVNESVRLEPPSGGAGAALMKQLSEFNVLASVQPSTMQSWLDLPDEKYRRIAEGALTLLNGRRLQNRVDFDVIVYNYARALGLQSEDDMPPKPEIDLRALEKAMVSAYNDKNGADAKTLEQIVE